jgi:hypothetical protein
MCEDRTLPSTFTVTDLGDAGAGAGLQGDLRYCLTTANTNADLSNRIIFQPRLTGMITLTQGNLEITKALLIAGPGTGVITISGDNASGVFSVTAAADQTVAIAGLTITGGTGSGLDENGDTIGGGLYNLEATVQVTNCVFTSNSAVNGSAIANERGTMVVNGCTLADNFEYHQHVQNWYGPVYNRGTMSLSYTTITRDVVAPPNGIKTIVFNLEPGTISMDHCSFFGNRGGVQNWYGTMSITACTIANNTSGAAVLNREDGTLTITDSTIANNVGFFGGGVNNGGEMTIRGSTISGNSAPDSLGGGIYTRGLLHVINSTVSGNITPRSPFGQDGYGGGIYFGGGLLEIVASTITQNRAAGGSAGHGGGGIYVDGPAALLWNTIVAGNTSAHDGPDVQGSVISRGHNLIGETDGSSGWDSSDLTGTSANPLDPRLGRLQDNGGPTWTHAVLPGSPALHAADPRLQLVADQRGSRRFDQDIGAFGSNPAVQFRIEVPSTVYQGLPFTTTVVALDEWGNVASTYTGTVHFTSTDFNAQLPDDTDFAVDAGGREDFTVTMETQGNQRIAATDVANPTVTGVASLEVVGLVGPGGWPDPSGEKMAWWFDGTAWHRRSR